MTQVKVIMNDVLENKEVERVIDISNLYVADHESECWKIGNAQQQKANLLRWIEERANEQHNTILELKSWEIIH